MPWLAKWQYQSLLRAAGRRIRDMGKDDYAQKLNLCGHLILRVLPQQLSDYDVMKVPFEYIEVIDVETKMIIFVVHKGEGLILEDDHAMFPTDELVAKLRLLMK